MSPPTKEILRDFSLVRFYIILGITATYFLVELGTAHFTHSLILQIDSYHMLYNVFSLITCIVTVKCCQKGSTWHNTFGWTRIHVCGVVGNICFLSALAFSVTVECIQTMIHADHHDSMHGGKWVAAIGAAGLLVNAICFFTIGGFTFHQNSFLDSHHQHQIGDDFVISASVQAYVQQGMKSRRRQGFIAIFRDIYGSVLVLLVAGVVFYFEKLEENIQIQIANNGYEANDKNACKAEFCYEAKFLDPVLTLIAVLILALLSFRLAKDAGHILLLTIPNHINVKTLLEELRSTFPELHDVHDFHVWQLSPERIVASAHIVLQRTENYMAMQISLVDFLQSKGISQITLQPEFLQLGTPDGTPCARRRKCFLPCDEECEDKQCCTTKGLPHCDSHQDAISEIPGPSTPTTLLENVTSVQYSNTRFVREEADEAELQPMI